MSKNINELIINWYDKNKRDLPWRRTTDPYKIWLSEIILQQTRVQQGMAYYTKFIDNFPYIEDLANADEQLVLQLWQGLGYYSRARNLHKTAKIITNEQDAIFPKTHNEIIKLPGVGDYTASAISSFAFNEPQAVLDGNVFRVLSRIFNWSTPIDSTIGKKEFRELAQEFLVKEDPAKHNQAIMEFGALLCTPQNPACDICPIMSFCESYKMKNIADRPVKSKKTSVRTRNFHFLHIEDNDEILIEKRKGKDIWQHLYQLPLIEITDDKAELSEEIKLKYKIDSAPILVQEPSKHLLSHQKLNIHFYSVKLEAKVEFQDLDWVKNQNLKDYPFPKPLVDYLNLKD
jgi:A/G-specific adenine glycosylase|tara:strand:- start:2799 stop:3833 length:1035 start_codon:yes stop_codon:yes gene_type:complete